MAKGKEDKSIVITPVAYEWAKANGYEALMNSLTDFVSMYRRSWQYRLKQKRTDKIIAAAQKRIDEATAELKKAQEEMYGNGS